MKIAVIGRGMIGSAAARHFALAGMSPTLIGPDEPADKRSHKGVFASHYDEGRITRKNATDPFWAEAAKAAISRYGEIEAASGIRFFQPVGALMMGPAASTFMASARRTSIAAAVTCKDLSHPDLVATFPYLDAPGMEALWEPTEAGHISPRRLVSAQSRAAQRAGATLVADTVSGVEERGGQVRVALGSGEMRSFDHVLVAAGGMTDHVLDRPAQQTVYARTVALLEVGADEVRRLTGMPSMVVGGGVGHYVLPPIRYPDDRTYLKIGGDPVDVTLESATDIADWFRSGGNPVVRDELVQVLRDLLPGLQVDRVAMDACVTTFTPNDRPEIAAQSPHVTVATAGCGQGAKCSDELGRRAAALVTQQVEEGKAA